MTIREYSAAARKLRQFFQDERGYVEVPAQSRLSILAACEDPETVSQFVFKGLNYPLPQTGQMQLEVELLKDPSLPGVFCQTTSYRDEQFPIEGRHDLIFPMFEFEGRGDFGGLRSLLCDLLDHFDILSPEGMLYETICLLYGVEIIGAPEEERMCSDYGSSIMLQRFPLDSNPFWNMRVQSGKANKIDVILYGMETIGSAERSCDPDAMREGFNSVSGGKYRDLLFHLFGKERVLVELEEYLALPMTPRFGGGIGMTRLIRALRMAGGSNG